MIQLPLMGALFGLPIQPPPHVILRSVEPVSETVIFQTTTPGLLQDLASSQPSSVGTLPQPIYPPPSGSGQSQGQGSTPSTVQPPPKTPAPQAEQPTENWADRIWQRYKGKGGSN